jgi:co-chaperonin GroES (HSP10)
MPDQPLDHITADSQPCPCGPVRLDPEDENAYRQLQEAWDRDPQADAAEVLLRMGDDTMPPYGKRFAHHQSGEDGPVQEATPIRLVPLRNKVLVELVEVREQDSSIFTAATVDGATEYGRVVAVGPKIEDRRIEADAIVQFGKFSGYAIEDEKFMLLREDDVNAIVEGGIVTSKRVREAEAAEEVARIVGGGAGLYVPENAGRIDVVSAGARIDQPETRQARRARERASRDS